MRGTVFASALEKIAFKQSNGSNAHSAYEQFSPGTFGALLFTRDIMEKMLPKEVKQNLFNAIEGHERIRDEYADTIALAMKEWAISHGATHFCHWFQPLSGLTAEKHDSFIEWKTTDTVIAQLSGKQLIRGEPDASSFPSGGLRSTYEARGYTGWDPSSPAFIWKSGEGSTLSIPSVFFSWTGEVLDNKIPLLRSDAKINEAVLRLLKLTGTHATRVFSTLGWEQEYFVIDRSLRNKRPDLVMLGQTVCGAAAPKGQQLQDHYFGAVKDRILAYMRECEERALELGIPVKTRHNEVAPAQHEVAAVYDKASRSNDRNLLMMEIMRQVAVRHDLACLLHEKPFDGINGSGKHNNWSLGTDTGHNLLDPTDTPEKSMQFLILLTAIIYAVHKHSALLRATVASFGNDYRLGGHEAPPAIMSVYLGETLESLLKEIEEQKEYRSAARAHYDLGVDPIPALPKDNTDRNRTSPFAFTGNKFEFRAVGASQSCAFPITVLNAIVASALNEMLDEIEPKLKAFNGPVPQKELADAALPVLCKFLKSSKAVCFSGDNYTSMWEKEAADRKLPNIKKSLEAFAALKAPSSIEVFKGILKERELQSRYEVEVDRFCQNRNIQVHLLLDMFHTQILPAALKYYGQLGQALETQQKLGVANMEHKMRHYQELNTLMEEGLAAAQELEFAFAKAKEASGDAVIRSYARDLDEKCWKFRQLIDSLEAKVDASLWPLPKYWEMLFLV